MAFTESKANIKLDLFEIWVDAAKAPYQASASWTVDQDIRPVTTARVGSTPIAHLLQGVTATINITWQQGTIAELETLFDTGVAAPRNLVTTSDTPTSFAIEMRPVGETTDAQSLTLFACVLKSITYDNDGQDERKIVTSFVAQLDTNDLIGRIGSAA